MPARKKDASAKSSFDGAIAKDQGKSMNGASLEILVVEAVLPALVATIVHAKQSDSPGASGGPTYHHPPRRLFDAHELSVCEEGQDRFSKKG